MRFFGILKCLTSTIEDPLRLLFSGRLYKIARYFDIGFSGYKYTYYNKRRGADEVRCRLDRVLATRQWMEMFPSAQNSHVYIYSSDYMALLLETNNHIRASAPVISLRRTSPRTSSRIVINMHKKFVLCCRMLYENASIYTHRLIETDLMENFLSRFSHPLTKSLRKFS
ncbi:hypothetical protein QQ045_021255 [Rhodiola kirilowii]